VKQIIPPQRATYGLHRKRGAAGAPSGLFGCLAWHDRRHGCAVGFILGGLRFRRRSWSCLPTIRAEGPITGIGGRIDEVTGWAVIQSFHPATFSLESRPWAVASSAVNTLAFRIFTSPSGVLRRQLSPSYRIKCASWISGPEV